MLDLTENMVLPNLMGNHQTIVPINMRKMVVA